MTDMNYSENIQPNSVNENIKTIGRPIFIGLLVTFLGVWPPIIIVVGIPGVGGLIGWIAYMVIFVLITSGRLLDKPDRQVRKERFRKIRLQKNILIQSAILALLFVIVGQSLLMVTFRFIDYPKEQFLQATNYTGLSTGLVWGVILFSALGAGVYEEIGFRGYMQQPMEKTHGFLVANVVSSLVFMVIHLNQLWASFILPHLFIYSFMFGVIAYVTKSVVPGIIAHFVLDIFNFGYWWSGTFGIYNHETIWNSSVDIHFLFWSFILVISSICFIFVARYANSIRVNDEDSQ